MSEFQELLADHGDAIRFHEFQNLMRYRIRDVLLVSSLYDSFTFEEDGQLHEMIMSVYHELNLTQAPNITRVSTGKTALNLMQADDRFGLIIVTLNLGDMHAVEFAERIRKLEKTTPVILLTFETRELAETINQHDLSIFEKVFIWQGDFRILIAIIKYVEDRINLDHDTRAVGVQTIILIEDNIHFYSSYLPMIYDELFRHHHNLISEGVNLPHKLLRMRARPKIILCSGYEEAWDYYKTYEEFILGVISDIDFPRNGKSDPNAGIDFAREVKSSHFDVPILLQSDSERQKQAAERLGVAFLLKTSSTLHKKVRRFMIENFAFGDFVFQLPDGTEVGRAENLKQLEHRLRDIPEASLLYHAERNHFSRWLKARTEFWLAYKLRPAKVSDYSSVADLRNGLIRYLKTYRQERSQGNITDFDPNTFETTSGFARIGGGSLGGKARGLGFANSLINTFKISDRFKGVRIFVPPTVVLGTDIFDAFMDDNNLREFAIESQDDSEIIKRFLEAEFPIDITEKLKSLLDLIHEPLAIRSSSLLEDSRYLPFAGIYGTFMIPNNHHDPETRLIELISAIKRVYASTFSYHTKSYIRATPYRLEEEKMAVIVQKLVGTQHEERFYPDFSGVARSHNFYPIAPMSSADGIVSVALGLGDTVIEGDRVIRFSPKYPKHLSQFSDVDDAMRYSQKELYALELSDPNSDVDHNRVMPLKKYGLDVAERDGSLAYVGSTYSIDNHAITDGLSRVGPRLVTFAPILKSNIFPLPEILELIIDMGSWGMSSPVEIEFAVNMLPPPGEPKEFAFLQIRPLIRCHEAEDLHIEDFKEEDMICQSPQILGNGLIDVIQDIVVVDYHNYDRSKSLQVVQEVAGFNAQLIKNDTPYLLIGVGGWGSADPWLGIPVKWEEIAGARVIVETGFKDFKVVPSQGTHFFQNITSFMVGYFTINSFSNEGFVDWDWLAEQKEVESREYTRLLHFDEPLIVRMDGHTNRGIILKPGTITNGEQS